jgi:hypothetical protein
MNESVSEVFQSLEGGTIEGGGLTEDGIHFFLKDGRVLVVGHTEYGEVYFGVAMVDKRNIQ